MPTMTERASTWTDLWHLIRTEEGHRERDLSVSLDWNAVAHMARRTGLGPLLYHALQSLEISVPPDILTDLEADYYLVAAANTLRFQELGEILQHLTTAGIPVLVLKGAALAGTAYGNIALRPMADLDLLIPREFMVQVPRLLEPLGYQRMPGPPGHSLAYDAQFGGEIGLTKATPAGVFMLDIHWHLLAHQWLHHATCIDMDTLWQAALSFEMDDLHALQFCPEDALLHICLHAGFSHAYAYLLNLVDVDRAVAYFADLNWDRVLQRAHDFEVRVPTYFGLRFAHDLMKTPVPDQVLAALRPAALRRWGVGHLAGPEQTLQGDPSPLPGSSRYLLHLALIDGLPGILRLARFLVLPGDDWLAIRYGLTRGADIRLARFWHPFRMAQTWLSVLVQALRKGKRPGSTRS